MSLEELVAVTELTSATSSADDMGSCIWKRVLIPEDSNHTSLFDRYYAAVFSVVSTFLLMWKRGTFSLKRLAYPETYKLFSLFILAMHLRVVVPKLCHFLMKYAHPKFINCEVCALMETFLSVFEIEVLTHLCIDRYVIAKYITRGWQINKNHYNLYVNICIFASVMYSIAPVFYLGSYAKDFSCDTCTFDMVLPNDWLRYVIVVIWILRSVKPAFFMVMMLFWARKLETNFTIQMKLKSDSVFTRVVETVTMACLFAWSPLAAVRGSVIASQLKGGEITSHTSEYISFAFTLYELSSVLVVIAVFLWNTGFVSLPHEDAHAPAAAPNDNNKRN